jgi:hypothetical protein
MFVALDTGAFRTPQPVDGLIRASDEQISAVVVPMDVVAENLGDSDRSPYFALKENALRCAIRVCALSARGGPHLGANSSVERQAAQQQVRHFLDGAKVAGADAIVVQPVAGQRASDSPSHARALGWVYDELRELRHEAEAVGVTIALDTADSGLLPSPEGAADFLDEVNSHAIGWQLDMSALRADSWLDWLGDLARSLQVVKTPAAPYDRDALLCGLRDIGYAGAIVVADTAEYKRWSALLDGNSAAAGKA